MARLWKTGLWQADGALHWGIDGGGVLDSISLGLSGQFGRATGGPNDNRLACGRAFAVKACAIGSFVAGPRVWQAGHFGGIGA